ncbi:MAG: hypothetical protein NTV34_05495, partial [Proteobacteria bacterium]|nr:hypothetical protein [Pseudomonadota bacterium]
IVLSAPVFQGDRNQVAGILAIGASGASVTGTVGGAYGKVFKDVKPNSMLRIYGDVKQGATIVCAELNPGNEYGCVFSPRKS